MKNHRGLTLVELLATLSVLTVLSIISVSWMTTILRSQSMATSKTNWSRASIALLDLIGQDILVVDRLDTGGRSRSPRVRIADDNLEIRTRDDHGIVTQSYGYDDETSEVQRRRANERAHREQIALLGETAAFTCEIELPSELRALPVLRVSLVAVDGRAVHRTYILEQEDAQ